MKTNGSLGEGFTVMPTTPPSNFLAARRLQMPGSLIWLRFDGPANWHRFDMREPVLRSPIPNEEILRLVQSLYTSFLTPRYVARKLRSVFQSQDHFRYYVVRGSRYLVGHLLDFLPSQLEDEASPRFSQVGPDSGVAELPVKLYTAGGEAAPVPEQVFIERPEERQVLASLAEA